MNLYDHCLVSVLKQLPILQDEEFPFLPNMYEDIDEVFPHLPKSPSLDDLPRTIRKDLNVLAQYNHALDLRKRKFSVKEDISKKLEESLIVYYETCVTCEECEQNQDSFSVKCEQCVVIRDNVIYYHTKWQLHQTDADNSASDAEKIKTYIPPHLSCATSYIELQFNY